MGLGGGEGVRGLMSQWQHVLLLFIYFFTGKGGRGCRRQSESSHCGGGTVSILDGRRFIVSTCIIDIPLKRGLSVRFDCLCLFLGPVFNVKGRQNG